MQLIITLRKEVANPPEARQIYELVKEKLSDHPEVIVTGHLTNHFVDEDPES